MNLQELHAKALQLLTPKKGILAADESNHTCNARFSAFGIPETEEARRAYRELLLAAPGMENYVTGVILYDETIRQSTAAGVSFPDLLRKKSVLVGIKVDEGLIADPNSPDEHITQGLDGLPGRLAEYKTLGAMFTKWRAAFKISGTTPSTENIQANAVILARYAKMAQDEGLVPIIEPEVELTGAHTIEQAHAVTEKVIRAVFEELPKHFVALEGVILKTSMVISGDKNTNRANAQSVARHTIDVLKAAVPVQTAGVVFLSGGQSPEEATENFREIARLEPLPWPLAFSFSRALQNDALKIWSGQAENVGAAQKAFLERLEANSLADQGR